MKNNIFILFLFISTVAAHAQLSKSLANKPQEKDGTTLIYLENSETLTFDQARLPDVQLLRGNVVFRHDDVLMYCDSAYFYEQNNSMDAFSNIRIIQGDTLFVYGDILYYDGNTKLARLRKNVKMVNKQTTLTTDSLNYDRVTNLAYYFTGGTIKDSLNVLTSAWGQYATNSDVAYFRKNVVLTNDNFVLKTDTLKYSTNSYIANIVGATEIVYQEDVTIYSKNGWYNTNTENSLLLDRSLIVHKDRKTLQGDSILYDKAKLFAEVFGNMILVDSTHQSTLNGNYGYYNEATEEGLATNKALIVEWSSIDTVYVHADTLLIHKDSIYNTMKGYYGVRIFRNDVQAVCDSLFYTDSDSIMSLYGTPIMWQENSQISADFIQIYMKDNNIDYAHLQTAAMIVMQEDIDKYNQLSGKEMHAYIKNKELNEVRVDGNAETVFYPKEDDGTFVGVNKTQSSFVNLYFKEQKIDKILFTTATAATMYPLGKLDESETLLNNFFWSETERPRAKDDVFLKPERTVRPIGGPKSATAGNKDKSNISDLPNKDMPAAENSARTRSRATQDNDAR